MNDIEFSKVIVIVTDIIYFPGQSDHSHQLLQRQGHLRNLVPFAQRWRQSCQRIQVSSTHIL